ncbi:MAG: MarR family transcriptional regulator [Bacteroidetes bacterium]|nr:MarR family transcriptional regulator [Bacteroidota bacterium]
MTKVIRILSEMIDEILELKKRCNFSDEIGLAFNLTLGEVACISIIAKHETLSSKNLSSLMDLSPSRGSRVISRLTDRGFIVGKPDKNDRRYLSLSLTEAGKRCDLAIQYEKRCCEERILAELTNEQKTAVNNGLNILLQVL